MFDEPEAALSPKRQLAALRRIHELVQADSQFVIATHSPLLLAYPDATIYELGETCVQVDYEDSMVVRTYEDFIDARPRRLRELLAT